MNIKKIRGHRKPQSGFTLIELLVVVLIIGILAAIAIPQYFKVVEKGKVAEAFAMFDALRGAQERYLAVRGNYCSGVPTAVPIAGCSGWDLPAVTSKYYTLPAAGMVAGAGAVPTWTYTITRNQSVANYGAYTLQYTITEGVNPVITCVGGDCQTDLAPQ